MLGERVSAVRVAAPHIGAPGMARSLEVRVLHEPLLEGIGSEWQLHRARHRQGGGEFFP